MSANKTCFVIAPIGEADSPIRKRSDQVLKYIIKPAAEECGFTTLRADEIAEPGIITSQVIQHITDDAMVVADLTGRNPNVFYELAIRHAIRKPYVQLIDLGEPLPFDVSGVRTIQFSHQDLDSAAQAKLDIIKQMKSMIGTDGSVESPITVAIDLNTLSKSKNPEDRRLGEVVTAIANLNQQVISLRSQLSAEGKLSTISPSITGVRFPINTSDGMVISTKAVSGLPSVSIPNGLSILKGDPYSVTISHAASSILGSGSPSPVKRRPVRYTKRKEASITPKDGGTA